MTEAEWQAATNPTPMWWFVDGKVSERKLRLFACACCRRLWDLFTDEKSKRFVEVAEQLADGLVTADDADRRLRDVDLEGRMPLGIDEYSVTRSALIAHGDVRRAVPALAASFVEKNGGSRQAEACHQCSLLRDVVGNPFRRVTIAPAWQTSTVITLARQMYDSREFSAMPVLADALQDAGCDNEDVLSHCRGPGLHVRGCWVVDLVLGKE